MIRAGSPDDEQRLEPLYEGSIYGELPSIVRWALSKAHDRVQIVEEKQEILASAYIDVCGYNNLWLSYLIFKNEDGMKRLIDSLMRTRNERGLRNFYVLCPKEFVNVRTYLISLGFLPECIRRLDGLEYIVENHEGTFNPDYLIPLPKEPLPVNLRKGETRDVESLAEILHKSLRDFSTVEAAATCVRKWLREMPDYIIVAEHNDVALGVILLSLEASPVLDRNLAMLCFLAVDERFRRRGIGEALIKEACGVLRGKGKSTMEVDTAAHNVQARIFYTKTGFYPFWHSRSYMPHDSGVFYRVDF